jgi:hypothetical protein
MRSLASLGGSHLALVVVGGVMEQKSGIGSRHWLVRSESTVSRRGDEVVAALIILLSLALLGFN